MIAVPSPGRSDSGFGNMPTAVTAVPAFVDALIGDYGWSLIAKDQPMTFRHLANMVSGYGLAEAPGAAWEYNSYGARLHAETLKRVFDGSQSPPDTALDTAAQSRIVTPLQFEDTTTIFTSRFGCGIDISPRDFARIGWWWLNRGNWDGSQLLPDVWFDLFTTVGVSASLPRTSGSDAGDYLTVGTTGGPLRESNVDNMEGIFGWMLWHNGPVAQTGVRMWPDAPTDMYMADGHFGTEVMVVIPSLSMVVAAVASWGDTTIVSDSNGATNNRLEMLASAVTGDPTLPATFPGSTWTTATDSEAGLATATLDSFITALGGKGVIVRNGYLVRSWGAYTATSDWASAAKSVVTTMLGFAGAEGLI